MRGSLPAGPFAPVLLFTEMPAVVAPEDDERVVGIRARVERVEQLADLGVDEGDASEITEDGGLPLPVLDDGFVRAGGHRVEGPLAAGGTEVREVVVLYWRQLD